MKSLPFAKSDIEKIIRRHPTPFYLYDEEGIRATAQNLQKALKSITPGSRNFFAAKALPNPHILKILHDEGMGIDASSVPELMLCERLGIDKEDIIFTSNQTTIEEYQKAYKMGALINFDDIGHISLLRKAGVVPTVGCIRYNPGQLKVKLAHAYIIGEPKESKYGVTKQQLFTGYKLLKDAGVKRFGIHAHIACNEINADHFVAVAQMLCEAVVELSQKLGIVFEFVDIGGGLSIPYHPDEKKLNIQKVTRGIKKAYEQTILGAGLPPLRIIAEAGRYVTGPHGYLVERVRYVKKTYRTFIGLDGSITDLMRPAFFKKAYHHITILGKEKTPATYRYDVVGSVCSLVDKLALQRELPRVEPGDIVVFHDAGAHGHTLGWNYNGKLRSAELLMKKDTSIKLIRRAETVDDLFRTIV